MRSLSSSKRLHSTSLKYNLLRDYSSLASVARIRASLNTITRPLTSSSSFFVISPNRASAPAFPNNHFLRHSSSTPMAAPTDTAAEATAAATGITISEESLAEALKQKLETSHVDVQDISGGCGQSFTALIVSPQFQGKTALARHRLVNAALKTEIAAIHAWTPRCLTPEQWEKEKENQKGGQ